MEKIDRYSIEDAQMVFEKLIPEQTIQEKVVAFLSDAIIYADRLKGDNWNLNLDKNGHFIRFNVGQGYCIEIDNSNFLIICDRISLKPVVDHNDMPVTYRGYNKKESVHSKHIDKVPDFLAKTPNSVGCLLPLNEVEGHLDYLKSSNKDFIAQSIKTTITPKMKSAHSRGAIEYLAEVYQTVLPSLFMLIQT